MSRVGYVISPSGAGKTTSARNLDPKSTFIINPLSKDLSWRGSAKQYTLFDKEKNPNGNMIVSTNAQVIMKWMDHIDKNMPHIKTIVLDDFSYVTIMELQRRSAESWSKYEVIVQNFLDICAKAKSLRDDIVVFILQHTEETDDLLQEKTYRAISFGKLLNEK